MGKRVNILRKIIRMTERLFFYIIIVMFNIKEKQ